MKCIPSSLRMLGSSISQRNSDKNSVVTRGYGSGTVFDPKQQEQFICRPREKAHSVWAAAGIAREEREQALHVQSRSPCLVHYNLRRESALQLID